jgi:iron complex outermembrane receptor protein
VTRAAAEAAAGQSPRNQLYLWSSWDLPARMEFDLMGRYVDVLPGFSSPIPAYIELDARWGWKPTPHLELSIVGQNLLQDHHLEFGQSPFLLRPLIGIPRGVYGQLTYRW